MHGNAARRILVLVKYSFDCYAFIGMSLGNTTYAVTWMYFIEPYVWTTNYFVHHQYTLLWFIGNVIVYGLIFDSWFYWTHRALHESLYLWNHIHTTHHSFKTPSAFCQDAVHPLEGLVQGRIHVRATTFVTGSPRHRSYGSLHSCASDAGPSDCLGILRTVHFLLRQ